MTGGIKKLSIAVFDSDGHPIDYQPLVEVKDANDKLGVATPKLKIGKGQNIIRVFDPSKPAEKANETLAIVNCTGGDKCGKLEPAEAGSSKPEQKGSIKITSPTSGATYVNSKTATISVKVEKKTKAGEQDVSNFTIKVKNKNKDIPQDDNPHAIAVQDLSKAKDFVVKIDKGVNQITVSDPGRPDQELDYVEINCEGNCGSAADVKDIAIIEPKVEDNKPYEVVNKSGVDAYVTVTEKSAIRKIQYDVINEGRPVLTSAVINVDPSAKAVKVPVTLKFLKGSNTIRIYDADNPGSNNDASIVIKCTGDDCATDFLVATIPTNSMNTRAIVGMEQVGASSASSETKPFLDFFFTNPIVFDKLKDDHGNDRPGPNGKPIRVPLFGTWGQVRLSTTPQQTASASVFPSNFVNQVTDPTKVVDLVQSFDYMAGAEFRVYSANGWNWTLIRGARQKSRLFFTFGAGAISPLNASRASAQIFKIPTAASGTTPASPQRAEFERRFGVPPNGKTYVGFVPLERDRFFRQYYFGLRLKTLYCDDDECTQFKNSFPSIVDFAVGQNEAVTGGKLKQDGKRAWVFRLDAFYPLPFREANFLYLYGTALMKIGQGGVRIDTPLFLDTAPGEVQITSTDVFIPLANQQPSQLNRDYYKIGIGVNLTDLFNRNKTAPH